ncbi:diguanylate cyclase [bacterium]|nr:diguanylate cyclase [bacterium]
MGSSEKKRILLASCSVDLVAELGRALGPDVRLLTLSKEDTLSREVVHGVDLVIMDLSDDDAVALRIAQFITEGSPSCMVFHVGNSEPSEEVRLNYPEIRPLPIPVDHSYLRGVIDSANHDRARIRSLSSEKSRIRLLYDLSSALLKVTSHRHIAKALEETLPQILDASMILLTFPTRTVPIGYFYTAEGVGELKMKALRTHLEDAWDVLRPDAKVRWEWINSLGNGRPGRNEHRLRATSFTTAPISIGSETEGFLTFLPMREHGHDEGFLQTFFVLADLLSVLVHNLRLKERLEQRATHDGLTGLLNRQTLIEQLERECRRSQRYQTPVSVVMLDIDHFKRVNDEHGHQAGDEALRRTADIIRRSIREMDIAGRCGGEEFVVVLPNTELEGAMIWAQRLRVLIETVELAHGDIKFYITASMGVAHATGTSSITDSMIARADAALYEAKNQGRNRVVAAREAL